MKLDLYALERPYWSKGWQAAASHGPRMALQAWTALQRAAYDAGYAAGERTAAQPGIPKPYGWKNRGARFPWGN